MKTKDWFDLVDLSTKPILPDQIQIKRVKIVCTIGPACEEVSIMQNLIRNGMDVARLNFSHGHLADHARRVQKLREAAKAEGKHLGILQDIQGPKIRVGRFEEGGILLKKGQSFVITTENILGNEQRVSCTYKNLHHDIRPSHRILLDDGLIFLVVEKIRGRDIHTRVVFGGPLKDSKGMNLPDTHVRISCLTMKDRTDLAFGLKHKVDFIALSFVQKAADIALAKKLISKGSHCPLIIAKIETAHAVQEIENILEMADGIMIARGDLGVECPMEQVPALQKQMIRAANKANRFVITATQMLESMTTKPRPTRAEASDVANAVLDGTDAVMLSAETASGMFPVESVKTMSRIIVRSEDQLMYTMQGYRRQLLEHADSVTSAVTSAAVQAAFALDVSAIVAFTHSGATANAVSRLRPSLRIFALTPFPEICRRLSIRWGIIPSLTKRMRHTDEMPQLSRPTLEKFGVWRKHSYIAILSGTPVARPGSTNLLKIHEVK